MKTPHYNEDIYAKVEMQNLILYAILSVQKSKDTCTFERLVAECFTRFPKVFGFKRFPQWPDSLKFDRPLRTLREKGLIMGSSKGHFSLTEFGEKMAVSIENELNSGFVQRQKREKSVGRSTDDRLINFLKDSEQYKIFVKNPQTYSITEPEFRNLLRCTLETPRRVLKQNIEYFKNIAISYEEEQLLKFLTLCEDKILKEGSENG